MPRFPIDDVGSGLAGLVVIVDAVVAFVSIMVAMGPVEGHVVFDGQASEASGPGIEPVGADEKRPG